MTEEVVEEIHLDPNPFLVENKWTPYEIFKAVLFTPLIPIRFLLVVVFMALSSFFAQIAMWSRGKDAKAPHAYRFWEYYLLEVPSRFCGRIMLFITGATWVIVKGQQAKPSEAPILVSNHVSDFDALLIYSKFPICFVAKQEVAEMTFVGGAATSMSCIFVNRLSVESKTEVRNAILKRAEEIKNGNNKYEQLLLFPEETVTNGTCMLQFKAGAFLAGVPVQPVCIRYRWKHFSPHLPYGVPMLSFIYRSLCQFSMVTEIEFLPVYNPSVEEKANPLLYGNNVRKVISKQLGIPTTEYNFTHCKKWVTYDRKLRSLKKTK